jgi:hypothetical protein
MLVGKGSVSRVGRSVKGLSWPSDKLDGRRELEIWQICGQGHPLCHRTWQEVNLSLVYYQVASEGVVSNP